MPRPAFPRERGFLIVCAGPDGSYRISGVPTGGVKIFFAPNNWACPDSNGHFNFRFYKQTKVGGVRTAPDGTLTGINATVPESGHASSPRSGAVPPLPLGQPVHR